MAVRLLAGPFTPTVDGAPNTTVVTLTFVMWWPGVGLVASGGPGQTAMFGSGTGIVTMDGRFCDRSNTVFGYPGWWADRKTLVQCETGAWKPDDTNAYVIEFQHDSIMMIPEATGPEIYSTHALLHQRYVKLRNRSLIYAPAGDHSFKVVVNGVIVGDEGPPAIFPSGWVQPGRSETDVFVAERGYDIGAGFTAARGIFYDTVTQQWSSPVYTIGMSCDELVYATDFGVMVSHHRATTAPGGGGEVEPPPEGTGDAIMVCTGASVFKFLALDGQSSFAQPASSPTPDLPVFFLIRTSEGHVVQQGSVTKVFNNTDLTVLSTYAGIRGDGQALGVDSLGNWYMMKFMLGVGGPYGFTRLNSASAELMTWNISISGNPRIVGLAVSLDGNTAYCWVRVSGGGTLDMRINSFDLSGSGALVGELHADTNKDPYFQSLLTTPDGDLIAAYTSYNSGTGAIVRYTPAGAKVWEASLPAGAGVLEWRGLTAGPAGHPYFLAWAYDNALAEIPPGEVEVPRIRYCWFSYATGAPDNTRNFLPVEGSLEFDGAFVVCSLDAPTARTRIPKPPRVNPRRVKKVSRATFVCSGGGA